MQTPLVHIQTQLRGDIHTGRNYNDAIKGLAATLAFRSGVDIEELLCTCHWSNQTTFTEFYLKDISVVQGGSNRLGPIVAAQQIIRKWLVVV